MRGAAVPTDPCFSATPGSSVSVFESEEFIDRDNGDDRGGAPKGLSRGPVRGVVAAALVIGAAAPGRALGTARAEVAAPLWMEPSRACKEQPGIGPRATIRKPSLDAVSVNGDSKKPQEEASGDPPTGPHLAFCPADSKKLSAAPHFSSSSSTCRSRPRQSPTAARLLSAGSHYRTGRNL
ncbi:unnamed protein product [Lampetra planeri]